MKKIAILGCENSHANTFLNYVKNNKEKFSDVEFVGVYSPDREAAEKLGAEFNIPVLDNYDDLVGKVDAIMITARHGDNHYKFAKPYMKDGIPMFIDKPVTKSEEDARALVADLRANNVRVCGGSSLHFSTFLDYLRARAKALGENVHSGYFRAPVSPDSPYGGFSFYSPHNVASMCHLFGFYPNTVYATKVGNKINAMVNYDTVTAHLTFTDDCWAYYAYLGHKDGIEGGQFALDNVGPKEFDHFYAILNGGESDDYEQLVSSVFILNAIERSFNSGKIEEVHRL